MSTPSQSHEVPIRRPVAEVPRSDGQMPLFPGLDCGEEAPSLRPPKFKDPDPRGIWLGPKRLDAYLESAGQGWVLKLRELLREQDWSAFEAKCRFGGRPPYAPAAMLGIVIYGLMVGRSSLRKLEYMARRDLGCMWVSGGISPDHSVIGRFLNLHQETLASGFFERLTASVLKKINGSAVDLSGDGTVIQAMASRWRTLTLESVRKKESKAVKALAESPGDAKLQRAAAQARKAVTVATHRAEKRRAKGKNPARTQVAPHELDAVVQPLKSKAVAPAYKASALANEQQIVVAFELDGSSETGVLPEMIEQAKRVNRGPVERLKLDAGYHSGEVMKLCRDQGIEVLCPTGGRASNFERRSKGDFSKESFLYEDESDTYVCPSGEMLHPVERYKGNAKNRAYVRYGTPACRTCPLREQCTRRKEGRLIKRFANDALKDEARMAFADPSVRAAYKQRAVEIEPVFAGLKEGLGLRRFKRRGLAGARLELAATVLAYNIKRALTLSFLKRLARGVSSLVREFQGGVYAIWRTAAGEEAYRGRTAWSIVTSSAHT